MSNDWLASWRQDFPEGPPVGYLLRVGHPERWLRTHSLPEAKRYPESEAEMQEILRRYAVVASDVLGSGPCLLFSATFDEYPEGLISIAEPEIEGLPGGWLNITAEPVAWTAEAFEDCLRDVANDASGPVLFYAVGQARAFAPYDGGADLFFESESVRAVYRKRYVGWLSTLVSGL